MFESTVKPSACGVMIIVVAVAASVCTTGQQTVLHRPKVRYGKRRATPFEKASFLKNLVRRRGSGRFTIKSPDFILLTRGHLGRKAPSPEKKRGFSEDQEGCGQTSQQTSPDRFEGGETTSLSLQV